MYHPQPDSVGDEAAFAREGCVLGDEVERIW